MSQWISDRPVPLDGVEGRWRDLCGGLLTKDVDDRWGGVEVGRWLAGEDPEVRRPTPSDPVAVPVGVAPFVFGAVSGDGVEAYDDPRLLAHAFGVHWDEALEIVSGRGGASGVSSFGCSSSWTSWGLSVRRGSCVPMVMMRRGWCGCVLRWILVVSRCSVGSIVR